MTLFKNGWGWLGTRVGAITGILVLLGMLGGAGAWVDNRYAKSKTMDLVSNRVTLNDLASWIRQNRGEMNYLRSKYGCAPAPAPCTMNPIDADRYNYLVDDTNQLILEYNELKRYLRERHQYRYR